MNDKNMEQEEEVYLSTVEVAKYIRKELKENFPNQKFKVRSSVYSGGSSIHIDWINGPSRSQVEEIVKCLEGAGFDGMIDLKYYKRNWILPNGKIIRAGSEGSQDSKGVYPKWESEKPEGAKPCHMGVDYIMCDRELTEEIQKECFKVIAKEENIKDIDLNNIDLGKSFIFRDQYYNAYQLVWEFTVDLDFTNFKELKAIPLYSGSAFGGYEIIRTEEVKKPEIKEDIPELIIKGNCIKCNNNKALFGLYCSGCLHNLWKEEHK